MPIRTLLLLSSLALLAPACGDNGGGGDQADAGGVDSAPVLLDAPVDAPDVVLGGDPIGTWRELPHSAETQPTPPEDRTVWIFRDDGTLEQDTGTRVVTGTWSITGDRLALTLVANGTSHTITAKFLATADRLLVDAMVPDGPVDGLVGTWRDEAISDGQAQSSTIIMRGDATVHADFVYPTAPAQDRHMDGIYMQTDADFRLEFHLTTPSGTPYSLGLRGFRFPGRDVLGGPLMERI